MAIDPLQLVLTARDMVTDLPESVTLPRDAIHSIIPSAIAIWQLQTANDPEKRQNFIVESGTITMTNNVADLAAEIASKGFRMEFIHEGDIEISYAGTMNFTVKFIKTLDRFKIKGRQDAFFIKCYMSGTTLRFCKANSPWTEDWDTTFKIRSVVIPSDLTLLPPSVLPELAIVLADELRKTLPREKNLGLSRNIR